MLRLNGRRSHGSGKSAARQGRRGEIYAETVTLGDPTFAGPLAGVPLGLCVCHVLEPEIKAEADAAKWDEQIGMMEMVLNVDALADAVRKMREANSKYPL